MISELKSLLLIRKNLSKVITWKVISIPPEVIQRLNLNLLEIRSSISILRNIYFTLLYCSWAIVVTTYF